jgi:hypothetical protein
VSNRSSLSAAVYLLLVFLSGALVGIFSYRLYTANTVYSSRIPRNPEEYRRKYVEETTTRLKLSGDQVANLQQILDETRQRYHDVHERYRPELKAIETDQYKKILSMLTETQRAEYENMRAERERRRQQGQPPKK